MCVIHDLLQRKSSDYFVATQLMAILINVNHASYAGLVGWLCHLSAEHDVLRSC